jgi:hypothetical protein
VCVCVCVCVEKFHVAQDKVQGRALVNTEIQLRVTLLSSQEGLCPLELIRVSITDFYL